MAIPLVIHHAVHFYKATDPVSKKLRLWKIHLSLFVDIQLMLFFTWTITGQGFPWFFFPFVAWGFLLAVHFQRVKKASNAETIPVQQEATPQPMYNAQPNQFPVGAPIYVTQFVPQGQAPPPYSPVYQSYPVQYAPQPALYPIVNSSAPPSNNV